MAGFSIDPETMRRSADELESGTAEVQGLLDQFTAALEQYADAFGGDTVGSLVGIAHQACADALNECFTTNIEELGQISTALREMADGHETGDAETAQTFKQLLGELGGSKTNAQ